MNPVSLPSNGWEPWLQTAPTGPGENIELPKYLVNLHETSPTRGGANVYLFFGFTINVSFHQRSDRKLVIACCQPTINDEDRSRRKTGFIGCEEKRGIRDVNRLPNPP